MARLSCGCLNIVLHTRGDRRPVEVPSLQLPASASSVPFFSENISEVQLDLGGISKEQRCLVQERSVGDWVTCKCSNCDTWCYAFHVVKKLDRVFVSDSLLSDTAQQDALRSSDDFSPLFKIILTEVTKSKEHSLVTPITGNEDAVRNNAAQLQEQLTKYLMKEKMSVDERIKKYAEEQKVMFASLQRRAYKDKNIMIGRILDAEEHQLEESLSEAMLDSAESEEEEEETPPRKVSVIRRPIGTSSANNQVVPEVTKPDPPSESERVPVINVRTLQEPQDLDRRVPTKKASADADPLFDIEDFDKDSEKPFFESDEDESSTDNSLTGESPLSRAGHQYATSVPISMPVWPKDRFPVKTTYEGEEDKMSPMPEPDRMVESMRALSMSVQDGTEMFGDLPRPRLNTGDFSRKKGPPF